ncbi:response regulator [Bernardetia sp. Wsw4-3y2]|uniref:response regulator n=1 Tax=Bernardetia sp. Wsw4-3y2 TaxID=3127471 RepID=UPI0030D01E47
MKWFNSFKLSTKITISFLIITVVVGVMSVFTLISIEDLRERSKEVSEVHFEGLRLLTHIAEAYPMMLVKTRDVILSETLTQRKQYAQQITRDERDIDEWTRQLGSKLPSEKEQELYEKYTTSLQEFHSLRVTALGLAIDEQDLQQANQLIYGELNKKAEELKTTLDNLIETKEKIAAQVQEDNDKLVQQAYKTLGGFGGLVFLITIFIPFWIKGQISRPIEIMEEKAEQVALGNLENVEFKLRGRNDEIGKLGQSFNEIVKSLGQIVTKANAISQGNYDVQLNVRGEKDDLSIALNEMTHSLRNQDYLKEGANKLNALLSGHFTSKEVGQKSISFLGEFLQVGCAVLYIYDEEDRKLKLYSSYAFTDRDRLSSEYYLGEGVVGQVAYEKKPIMLRNIPDNTQNITTGTISKSPSSTYTFPLLYENELCGVIELASFEPFTELKKQLITSSAELISSHLYSALQSERIKNLFEVAQSAKREAQSKAKEIEKANALLKEEQMHVQQQSEELQQQNEEMQQQAEELQQTNEELQQQQEQLERHRTELQIRNEQLTVIQADLEEQADELGRASKYKSEFLANMSHELRTPLNSIILLSDMLRRNSSKNLSEKEVQKCSIVYQSGNDLLNLINDILDISKIEAGKMSVNIYHFHTGELLSHLKPLFDELARQKKLDFIVDDQLGIELFNDRDKISQVLKNFLSNAFKFTKKGSVTIRITKSNHDKLPVKISVIDSGIGIPHNKQKVIFEAFQQVDGSVSREFGGTGLGLSIARELTNMLGGEVHLSSEHGKGSEFYMLLPIENHIEEEDAKKRKLDVVYDKKRKPQLRSNADDVAQVKEQAAERKYKRVAQLAVEDDRENANQGDDIILIVEDNVDYANSLVEISRGLGFKSIIAVSGKEFWQDVEYFNPLGVLLDLGLPDITGAELLEQIKTKPKYRHIPITIVSARDRNIELLEKGAVGYLQKPIEAKAVRDEVLRLTGISHKSTKQMLIVEDDEFQQNYLLELFDKEGVVCKGVATEAAAKQELETGNYDIVIADLKLEQGTGMGLCRFIKEHSLNIPVIIYTGKDLTASEKEEMRLYSVSVIIKHPQAYTQLLEKAKMFLHQVHEKNPTKGSTKKEKEETTTNLETNAESNTENSESENVTTFAERDNSNDHFNKETSEDFDSIVNKSLESYLADEADEANSDDLRGKRILIVDDDIRNVFVMTSALENHDADIIEAFNGKEALEVLEEESVDLILMDIMMPIMNGFETIENIRKQEKWKDLPIIAVTAKALEEDRKKCLEVGANDYMTKPVDYTILMKKIKQHLNKQKA